MKKFIILSVTLLISISLSLPCFAQIESKFIIDDADLLSHYEEQYLLTEIEDLIAEHGYDIVIHTTPEFYSSDIASYSDNYYDNGGYAADGLIFVISMAERDYCLSTCGALVDSMPQYETDSICDYVVPFLSDGEYFTAFETLLSELDSYFSGYASGEISPDIHYDEDNYGDYHYDDYYYDDGYYQPSKPNYFVREIVAVIIGVAVSLIITTVIKSKMNTAVKKSDANDYVVNGSFVLSGQRDMFVGSHVSRRAIPKNNNTGHGGKGGGGGARVSTGGVRHGGSSGKF